MSTVKCLFAVLLLVRWNSCDDDSDSSVPATALQSSFDMSHRRSIDTPYTFGRESRDTRHTIATVSSPSPQPRIAGTFYFTLSYR